MAVVSVADLVAVVSVAAGSAVVVSAAGLAVAVVSAADLQAMAVAVAFTAVAEVFTAVAEVFTAVDTGKNKCEAQQPIQVPNSNVARREATNCDSDCDKSRAGVQRSSEHPKNKKGLKSLKSRLKFLRPPFHSLPFCAFFTVHRLQFPCNSV